MLLLVLLVGLASAGRIFFTSNNTEDNDDNSIFSHSRSARLSNTFHDNSTEDNDDNSIFSLSKSARLSNNFHANSTEEEGDPVVFEPAAAVEDEEDEGSLLTPDCGEGGAVFCRAPANYPYAAISKALAKDKHLVSRIRSDSPSSSSQDKKTTQGTNFARAQVDSDDTNDASEADVGRSGLQEVNLCRTRRETVTPRAAKNVNGEYLWIVNLNKKQASEEEYTQVVTTTLCTGADKPCSAGDLFPSSSTVCKQEYAEHKLLALGKDGKGLVIDTFRFPSCCSCHLITGLEL
jgi:hypothetical protein